MSRRFAAFILLAFILIAAFPAVAEEKPLSAGLTVGGLLPYKAMYYYPMSAEASVQYRLLDWLSLRADAGCVLYVRLVSGSRFPVFPEASAGVEIGPFWGFYGILMGGAWINPDPTFDPNMFYYSGDIGLGFGIWNFNFEFVNKILYSGSDFGVLPFLKLGYRFSF